MSAPHYLRILVTNPATHAYMLQFMDRRVAAERQLKEFALSVGRPKNCRFGFEDKPFSFEDFTEGPDKALWKRHKSGGYCLREKVAKKHQAKLEELRLKMAAIQRPSARTMTAELTGDIFVYYGGRYAHYLTLDDLGEQANPRFIISHPMQSASDAVPEKAALWGEVIKESRYHELLEARQETLKAKGSQ